MGMVQTSYRGSHKTGGTMDMEGVLRGGRTYKRLRPRKVIEGAQKKLGRPYGYQGNGGGSPARRTTDFSKGGVTADIFGHRAPRRHTEKWAMQ